MKAPVEFGQKGQTLILVALAMFVLLAFLALAIEVGHLYGERRHMQNAADAGALAGARELCFGDPALAADKAREYAVDRNLAVDANVSIDGGIVTVVASEVVDTVLAPVIGVDDVDVNAVAAAACGAADSACGLWPIAMRDTRWEELYQGGNGCGRPFFVWHGDNENQLPDCDICDCDLIDHDGINDIVGLPSRGWVDFSDVVDDEQYPDSCASSGCGAAEVTCWVENDSTAVLRLPGCIPGVQGVKAGVKDEVDGRAGDSVSIPVYDSRGCMTETCPGGGSYHIIAFACMEVVGWRHNFELPYIGAAPGGAACWKGFVIEATVSCGGECVTYCGSTSGRPPEPWEIKAVSLIR